MSKPDFDFGPIVQHLRRLLELPDRIDELFTLLERTASATEESLLSIKQVAKQLNISTATVRRRLKDGTLLGRRVGRRIRIPREELTRLPPAVRGKH